MRKNQALLRLGPRINLFSRQMQEWNALLVQQSQVRFSTKEHEAQKVKYYPKNRLVILQQITEQALRLNELMERQLAERGQLRIRHQQEEATLEHTIDTHIAS